MQVWCDWQLTLCDPHLSALEVRFHDDALYKSMFTFTLLMQASEMAERKRSNVWMHFSMSASSNEVAKCDICKREYSIRGGTSNLSKHLRVKYIIDDMKFFLWQLL